MFCKKGVLRNFAKLTGRYLCQSLLFNKAAAAFDGNQKQESNFQEVDGLVTKELLFFVHSGSPSTLENSTEL